MGTGCSVDLISLDLSACGLMNSSTAAILECEDDMSAKLSQGSVPSKKLCIPASPSVSWNEEAVTHLLHCPGGELFLVFSLVIRIVISSLSCISRGLEYSVTIYPISIGDPDHILWDICSHIHVHLCVCVFSIGEPEAGVFKLTQCLSSGAIYCIQGIYLMV